MGWMIMPLRRYADFRGRSQAIEFWMWMLFLLLVTIVMVVLDDLLGLGARPRSPELSGAAVLTFVFQLFWSAGLLTWMFWLMILVPHLAVQVRRLHDSNRSGWWIFLPVAPWGLSFASLAIGGLSGSFTMLLFAWFFALLILGGAVTLIVFYCLDGTRGVNRYGIDPRAPETADDLAGVFD
ncbi:DUF805 domain-containing protein [Sphingomonas sp. RT2P30]|uniref:DUF805 domain-containing protein n=1 Tax=Parasphingomonas halimpatiens TaxID=3096162 RepID=UPI002FC72B7E